MHAVVDRNTQFHTGHCLERTQAAVRSAKSSVCSSKGGVSCSKLVNRDKEPSNLLFGDFFLGKDKEEGGGGGVEGGDGLGSHERLYGGHQCNRQVIFLEYFSKSDNTHFKKKLVSFMSTDPYIKIFLVLFTQERYFP